MECFHWSKSREVGKEQRKDRRIEKGDKPCRLRETRKQACRNHHNKKERKKGKERASGEARQGGRGVRESAESMTPNRN